jgi:hypothetical protein
MLGLAANGPAIWGGSRLAGQPVPIFREVVLPDAVNGHLSRYPPWRDQKIVTPPPEAGQAVSRASVVSSGSASLPAGRQGGGVSRFTGQVTPR